MRGVVIASISVAMVTVVLGCMPSSKLEDAQYDKDLIDILYKNFPKVDTNGDKIIDREEIIAIWAKNGDEEKALFDIIDKNGDGIDQFELAKAELKTNRENALNMVKQELQEQEARKEEELKEEELKEEELKEEQQEELKEEVNEIIEKARKQAQKLKKEEAIKQEANEIVEEGSGSGSD